MTNIQTWDDEKESGTGNIQYRLNHNGASYRLEISSNHGIRVIVKCRAGVANDGMGNSEWDAGYVNRDYYDRYHKNYAAFDREGELLQSGFAYLEQAADFVIDNFGSQEWIERDNANQ